MAMGPLRDQRLSLPAGDVEQAERFGRLAAGSNRLELANVTQDNAMCLGRERL